MIGYITKALFILLVYVLIFRAYLKWAKNSPKKIKPIIAGIIAIGSGTAAVFLLTLFEVLFCLAVFCAIFIFRKKLYKFYNEMLSGKYGKLKAAGFTVAAAFALWLGLALFYRTDFGMPIGVQNYLFHKYNEEFEVSGFFGATIAGHPTNQLTCYPKNGNKATDCFNVARKNTLSIGSRRFASDNYYGIIIRDDYEKYVSDIIDDYFDDFTVNVYFEFSGLSNIRYMSDEFDKGTSLEEFLAFQKDEDNIRACNFARLDICLNFQPTISEQEFLTNKSLQLFEKIASEFNGLRIYITSIEDNYNVITGLITFDSNVDDFRISDSFFKNEEDM